FIMNYKTFYLHTTLVFTLLLSINALITEINRLNYNELIVYNTPKNPSIHLIHGKKNYIISEEKINEDEMHYFPAITTVRKLGLKHPVFLISSDTFTNGEIFLKNGFAFFEGKTIMLRKNLTTDNKGRLPDFIINPTNTEIFQNLNNPHTTVISNKRYINQDEMKIAKIHFITLQGAFRKKW
ncbi:MAG TPA: hypothetical protein VK872_08690, partial [Draconibacterium sp.]|nr:hypothetical protein [Draconibacterium sp.]